MELFGVVEEGVDESRPKSAGQENQDLIATNAQHMADGAERMEAEINHARQRIEDIIQDLSHDVLKQLFVEFAAVGTGSEEYVRDLIFSISNPGVAIERPNSQPWCKCGVCFSMPDPEENKCCGRVICVTSYQLFNKICIDRDVLKLQIMANTVQNPWCLP
eukprot:gene7940-13830_t